MKKALARLQTQYMTPVGRGRAGDGGVEHLGVVQYRAGRQISAVGPATDRDRVQVEEGMPLRRRVQGVDLVVERGRQPVSRTAFSHSLPRPGVPRPSVTSTAKPCSANHCDTAIHPPSGPDDDLHAGARVRVEQHRQPARARLVPGGEEELAPQVHTCPSERNTGRGVTSGCSASTAIRPAGRPPSRTVTVRPSSVTLSRADTADGGGVDTGGYRSRKSCPGACVRASSPTRKSP